MMARSAIYCAQADGMHGAPLIFILLSALPGFRSVVTELFDEDDPYIEQDAAFGVRESIVVKFQRNDSAEDAAALRSQRHHLMSLISIFGFGTRCEDSRQFVVA